MRREGVPEAAVATFGHYYERLRSGASGLVPESEIRPVQDLPELADLPADLERDSGAVDRAVVIKLNGGLGTSMGMTRA
jgi:UTP--glucose-1-phosphate uridylyltransferase